MSMDVVFEPALPQDLPAVRDLLAAVGLHYADLTAAHLDDFVVCRLGSAVIGCLGVERYGSDGLLRSFAVRPAWRGSGLGPALIAQAERRVQGQGVRALYLLTTTAAGLLEALGYRPCARAEVPAPVRASAEFTSRCPADAVCLAKSLEG
ncbi:amino-acid N-acetyltransferase [Plasticicumulans lactativorans]|uniref:Amino-acid N-acetyltransferase n=1 Tax=Plasticicumulans lactativorans TaxID=1133106 RepID=A0A4R2L1W6_9GAMM|nr:arsenic resistance N-acetyltransferase ArsN2 [Plasticicumulans lactativorans]TCO80293.1 amino-acid N-acetyltransferase [Plasticicumulans lactativorans]